MNVVCTLIVLSLAILGLGSIIYPTEISRFGGVLLIMSAMVWGFLLAALNGEAHWKWARRLGDRIRVSIRKFKEELDRAEVMEKAKEEARKQSFLHPDNHPRDRAKPGSFD